MDDTSMTITLKNPTRQPACYALTLDCATAELPAVSVIRLKTVYAEAYPHKAQSIAETVKAPPTLTISGRETRKGLPDAVANAPEIKAAVAAGQLIVIQEPAAPENVYKRPIAEIATETATEAVDSAGAKLRAAAKPKAR